MYEFIFFYQIIVQVETIFTLPSITVLHMCHYVCLIPLMLSDTECKREVDRIPSDKLLREEECEQNGDQAA